MSNKVIQTAIKNTHQAYKNDLIARCAFVRVHEAPHDANITMSIGSKNEDKIKMSKGDFLRFDDMQDIYFSSDKADSTDIVFITSNDKNFKIETSPIMKLENVVTEALINQNVTNLEHFGNEAKSILQFLPTDSVQMQISANSYLELDITDIKALKFQCTGDVGLDIKDNGIKYPIKANEEKELFTHFLNSKTIKIYNDTANEVIFRALIMGDLKINLDYVENDYVDRNYVY